MADLKKMAEEIVGLTLLEAQELKTILKDEYGIEPAAGGAVMMAGPGGDAGGAAEEEKDEFDVISGSTVQLPTFAFTQVSTTVSVPDGGTILLGGIKRLSEGRTERGVPMLSKIPYLSRLFRNVAVGRDASSLMLMVTPRIIIQEEEEFAQTGYTDDQ